jgi:hypothetical protein
MIFAPHWKTAACCCLLLLFACFLLEIKICFFEMQATIYRFTTKSSLLH